MDDALNGPINEPQPLALKATRSKETLPSKVAQIEAAGLNDEEMALIIKRFKTALKGRKGQPSKTKTKGKRSCFKCGKLGHFIANCPDNDSDQDQGNKREKKKHERFPLALVLLDCPLRPLSAVLNLLMMRAISSSLSPAASICATLLGSASLLLVALRARGCGSLIGPFKASSTYLASLIIIRPLTNFPSTSSGDILVYLGFSRILFTK